MKRSKREDLHGTSIGRGREVLLMTCNVKVITPDGSVTQARALLDSAASTSQYQSALLTSSSYRVATATSRSVELQELNTPKRNREV